MTQTAKSADDVIWEKIYHKRVDRLFLPLGIRQNRIEDIFTDFLASLVAYAHGRGAVGTSDDKDRFGILEADLRQGVRHVSMPEDDFKRSLVFRWLRSELVRNERSSNSGRTRNAGHSIVPLHVAVAERFGRPEGGIPNYGECLCEMLTAGRPAGREDALLKSLWDFFKENGGDPLATILELALSSNESTEETQRPWALPARSLVRCPQHARAFQRDVEHVLRFVNHVSRSTMLVWLYSLFAFHLATYFLRMAKAAQRCATSLAKTMESGIVEYQACQLCGLTLANGRATGSCSNEVQIVLGERNLDHARLMKRYPYYTSQLPIAKSYFEQLYDDRSLAAMDEADALASTFERIAAEVIAKPNEVKGWFEMLAGEYPVHTSTSPRGAQARSAWRLAEADKRQALELLQRGQATAFETVAFHLNFNDMSRASNSIQEWQFYQTLARDPVYGFASGRGEELNYKLSDGLLAALVHAHIVEVNGEATVRTFEESLESRGLRIDDGYRSALMEALVNAGTMEAIADAGDAKRLSALYEWDKA